MNEMPTLAQIETWVDQVSTSPESDRVFRAPGPEAAWAWLMTMIDAPGATVDHPMARSRAVYRGQADSSWGLAPTLLRVRDCDRQRARCAAQHFAAITQFEFQNLWNHDSLVSWPPLNPRSGEAAAQHFGMLTPLLDWSSSYSVALDFASRNADGRTAAVWWFYLSDADELNLKLLLPPPYVHRLYLQRGLFVEVEDEEMAQRIEAKAYKIEFPATHHEQVKYIENGCTRNLTTLEPPEPWFEELRTYVNSPDGMAVDESGEVAMRALLFHTRLTLLKDSGRAICLPWQGVIDDLGLATWLGEDGFLRQIPEYILALAQRTTPEGVLVLDSTVIGRIEKDNPELMSWAMDYVRAIVEERRRTSPSVTP